MAHISYGTYYIRYGTYYISYGTFIGPRQSSTAPPHFSDAAAAATTAEGVPLWARDRP